MNVAISSSILEKRSSSFWVANGISIYALPFRYHTWYDSKYLFKFYDLK